MAAHRRTSGTRDPDLPEEVDLRALPRAVRAELRGLTPEAAEFVGGHLLMAGELVESDPALAFAHAEAARRRASRLPIVREASAETAYAAGEFAHALSEYRALRRMTGNDEYLPVMADCERALGRLPEALALAQEAGSAGLGPDAASEALMVQAGVREDMGQAGEGLRLLKSATRHAPRGSSRESRARLCYAYADALLRSGAEAEAVRWFQTAADHDREQVTDAVDRLAELQGMVLEVDEDDELAWGGSDPGSPRQREPVSDAGSERAGPGSPAAQTGSQPADEMGAGGPDGVDPAGGGTAEGGARPGETS